MKTKTQIQKISKTRDTSLKNHPPKVNKFIKMFDAVIFGKGQNVALNEEVKKILLKNSNDKFLLNVASIFYVGGGCPDRDYDSQNEKLKTLRKTINRESKKLVKEVDKEGKKVYPNFKNAISFKLTKGENFKENKNDFSFNYSTLEIKETVVNLDKLISLVQFDLYRSSHSTTR